MKLLPQSEQSNRDVCVAEVFSVSLTTRASREVPLAFTSFVSSGTTGSASSDLGVELLFSSLGVSR